MSVHDLIFKTDNEVIYDPEQLTAGTPITITVTNFGTETLTDLGLFLVPANSVGDVDFPADYPPETDYQDLLEWGTSTALGITGVGGLQVTAPQNSGSLTVYFRREQGASLNNKIPFQDLDPNQTATFTLTLQTPPSVPARRLYVDVSLE
jgi:hypothetical protein